MDEITSNLVSSIYEDSSRPDYNYGACYNAYGLYNSMHFVIRLSPIVHNLVDSAVEKKSSNLTYDELKAYSTYIHETVHWWQHIGSTSGFILSLGYPSSSYINHEHLLKLAEKKGAGKPIKEWAEKKIRAGLGGEDEYLRAANIVTNNILDIDYFREILLSPSNFSEIRKNTYFECVGHSYIMAYSSAISVLASTWDKEFEILPDIRKWEDETRRLKNQKEQDFYHGSSYKIPPLGMLEVIEGQARFIQLQFLSCASGEPLKIKVLEKEGYFQTIYGNAFREFLKISETKEPDTVEDPAVGLFLLICDIAINPTVGFPINITDFKNFVKDTSPGTRFFKLCLAVKKNPILVTQIENYSKTEYLSISEKLCKEANITPPSVGLEEIRKWVDSSSEAKILLEEQKNLKYQLPNLPIRVLFSHFLAFSLNKLENPEFFCWAGMWMGGKMPNDHTKNLWLSSLSLFTDKADDNGIFPRMFEGKEPENISETFNNFYGHSILYDLSRQWVIGKGEFKYDYSWLSEKYSEDELKAWAESLFKNLYKISPDNINLA